MWRVSRLCVFPVLFCGAGLTLRDPLLCWGPLLFALKCCHGFFERHCCFMLCMFLHVFVTFLLFFALFCMFMHCVLRVAFVPCVAPCMVHGIGMHVMHHIIIMCSSSCSSCSLLIIIDHHHVRCSLINDQSLNIDCCSLIIIDR